MICESSELKMADFVTGRLGEDEATEMESHLLMCQGCRDFHERISRLYAIDLPLEIPAPSELRALPAEAPGPKLHQRWIQAAAALLVIGVGLGVYLQSPPRPSPRPEGELPANTGPAFTPIALEEFRMDLPELPLAYPHDDWIESREEAVLASRFVGKPLFEQYYNPDCTRCQSINEEFDNSPRRRALADFIRYRGVFNQEVPKEFTLRFAPPTVYAKLPVVMISGRDCWTEPMWEIESWDQVYKAIGAYEKSRKRSMWSTKIPLDEDLFNQILESLREVPELVASCEYAEAMSILDEIIHLEERFATEFAEVANALKCRLLSDLERQVEVIADLHENATDEVSRLKVADLARRFAARVDRMEIEERVRPYYRTSRDREDSK